MIDKLICMLFGYKLLQSIFNFNLAISCCNKFFQFDNQVKICVAINLAEPVYGKVFS